MRRFFTLYAPPEDPVLALLEIGGASVMLNAEEADALKRALGDWTEWLRERARAVASATARKQREKTWT